MDFDGYILELIEIIVFNEILSLVNLEDFISILGKREI